MKRLGDFATRLLEPGSDWLKEVEAKRGGYTHKTLRIKRGIVKNYIIPIWGKENPRRLGIKKINNDLMRLTSCKTGEPLSGVYKNKIMDVLDDLYTWLVEEGIVRYNPVRDIGRFSSRPTKFKRGAISHDQMAALFPQGHDALLCVWGSRRYACAALILRDTGLRPGELIALKWGDWDRDLRFFPILRALEPDTREEKTTKTGTTKPALVSERTAKEIEGLRDAERPDNETYIFAGKNGRPYSTGRLCHAFHQAVKRAGFDRPELTPYWLRHTFNTRTLEELPDDVVRRLMGHLSIGQTRHYRDADAESLRKEAAMIRTAWPDLYSPT